MKMSKIFFAFVALIYCCVLFATPTLADNKKDETIYALLDYDGKVNEIYVVNHLLGEYKDYGKYTSIKNLSTTTDPVVEGDKITFTDSKIDGGLYYQGKITGELPMKFDIQYYLDEKLVDAKDLAGASGNVEIKIDYKANEQCDEKVRNGFMAQIALSLNMENCNGIVSYGATCVVVGNTINLNHTILSTESGTISVMADVVDFEMAPISISLIKGMMSLDSLGEKFNGMQYGFDGTLYMGSFTSGIDEMIGGTSLLKEGTQTLVDGLAGVDVGMSTLSTEGEVLQVGMDTFATGLGSFSAGLELVKEPSTQIKDGLNTLSTDGSAVAEGVKSIDETLNTLSTSVEQLLALANSMLSSDDPQLKGLAQSVILVLGGVDELSAGLSKTSDGVSAYMQGVNQMATQYATFDESIQGITSGTDELSSGFASLKDGTKAYFEGVSETSTGINTMYESSKDIPENVGLLIDGQNQLKGSLEGAITQMFSSAGVESSFAEPQLSYVSFASQKNNDLISVQYILTTPSIVVEVVDEVDGKEEQKENFFTRLLALFKKHD